MKKNRVFSFAVILLAYLVAFIGGALVWHYLGLYLANIRNDNLFSYYILLFLVSDVVATIIIWIFSTIFNNASIYDPYWSVLPMVMVVVFAKDLANFAPHTWIMIALVEVWGLRLTINWALSFKDLTIQDFRYDHYKQKFPKLWPLVNLFGIHLFPTLVVFLGMLSVIAYMQATPIFNLATFMSIALCIAAIAIEMVADIQMKQARKKPHHGLIITGLWKRSRHPNYLGEITFWLSLYLIMLSLAENRWILGLGPMVVLLLFGFVSVPLMEKHLSSKYPEYAEYKKTTNTFLIFPAKSNPKDE